MNAILADIAVPYSTSELFQKLGIKLPKTVANISKNRDKPKVLTQQFNTDLIIESNRNNTLTSLAGSMRRKGAGEETIHSALMSFNDTQVYPPLPVKEVNQIATSIMRYPSAIEAEEIMQSMNDVGNVLRFNQAYQGQINYVLDWETWIIWQNNRWIKDSHGVSVLELAKTTVKTIFIEAASQTNPDLMRLLSKHANTSNSLPRIKAMLEMASHHTNMCIPAIKLDSNPMLLGVGNGVVNLSKGRLLQNKSNWLITCYSDINYDKKAKCPTFIKFLKKIFKGDKSKIAFIKRIIGYCLTGKTDEQVYFFFFGFGANGKTTLLRVIELLLGSSLSKQTPAETLMANLQGNKQSNDLARLQSVRVVIANEVEDGSRLAESLIKQVTGGDTVTARFLFKEFFEFRPEFKLIIAGNHKPIIKSADNGIWRRTILVDFPVSIPKSEQDPALLNKLQAELPGILNWAIAGCLQWQKIGLAIPASVEVDTAEYKEEMDWLGQWIADDCKTGPNLYEKASILFNSYKAWSDFNGIHPSSAKTLGRRLVERGFKKSRRADGHWYEGLTLSINPRM